MDDSNGGAGGRVLAVAVVAVEGAADVVVVVVLGGSVLDGEVLAVEVVESSLVVEPASIRGGSPSPCASA